jgi:hypothetical protein
LNEGKVVGGEPVVARRYPTTLLDPIEEPLHPVTGAVEIQTEADRIAAIAFRAKADITPPTIPAGTVENDPYVWSGPGDPGELVSDRNRQHCGLINAPLSRFFPTGALLKLQE